MEITTENRHLTYGEKAVGITFSPGKNDDVEEIKRVSAHLIDLIYKNQVAPGPNMRNGEVVSMSMLAIRSLLVGQMWAVKAATWQY